MYINANTRTFVITDPDGTEHTAPLRDHVPFVYSDEFGLSTTYANIDLPKPFTERATELADLHGLPGTAGVPRESSVVVRNR